MLFKVNFCFYLIPFFSFNSIILPANVILQNIDESVDPCEDFYQFSCGSFNNWNRIKESQSKISEFSKLRDKVSDSISDILAEPIVDSDIQATKNAKQLYESCLNEGKYLIRAGYFL